MSSEMFYPSGDDVDRMIELAIQCGIDNRGTSWPLELCRVRAKLRAILARTEAGADDPILRGLARAVGEIDPDDGRWVSCSGCYETEDGHPVGDYPHSPILCCALGAGCSECGGLGAVWDTTDYAAFAEEQMADHPQDASGDAERYRWLRTGLYSENIEIGEAELVLRCYGAAPTLEQFDAAIDSAMQAKEAK